MPYCTWCFPRKSATHYCPDSPLGERLLCEGCVTRLHEKGTKKQFNSIEVLAPDHGLHLFTPILDIILLPVMIMYFASRIPITSTEYFQGDDICPAVRLARGYLFYFDSALTYLLKPSLALLCSTEDGYWRFFMDAWVRGVVTQTDSWALLLATLPRALIWRGTFRKYCLDPILSLTHSTISVTCYYVEKQAPNSETFSFLWSVAKTIRKVTDVVNSPATRVPLTYPRARPDMNVLEGLLYRIQRKFRLISHFYSSAAARVNAFFLIIFTGTLAFRVLSIIVSIGYYPCRLLEIAGLGGAIGKTTQNTALLSGKGADELSATLLAATATGVNSLVWKIVWYLFLLAIMMLPMLGPIGWKLAKQTKQFKADAETAPCAEHTSKLVWPPLKKD